MASGELTLQQLKDQSRQRADMVHSDFITDAELTSYINQSYFELYDLVIQKYGDDYFCAPALQVSPNGAAPYQTDGESQFYALPNGTNYGGAQPFYKLLGADLSLSPQNVNSLVTLRRFNFSDRNRYAVPNFQSFYGITNLRYRLHGNYIWFTPIPAGGQIIQIWYVPRLVQLVDDDDVADGISGWLEYVIVDTARKMLQKEESDTAPLVLEKNMLIQRIEAAAENRDAANPATVSDTQWQDYGFPSGNGSPYGGSY